MIKFIENNFMPIIAFCLAVISVIFVPIDGYYKSYINWTTIGTLFLTLSIVTAFSNINIFEILAFKIVKRFHSLFGCSIAIIVITFIVSMFLANDMALLSFVPLSLSLLRITKNDKYAAYLISLQVISANLGGMITPFGNPQNMYLYSYFNISLTDFTKTMLPSFILSIFLISIALMILPKQKIILNDQDQMQINFKKTIIYSILFLLAILSILRIIPLYIALPICLIVLIFIDYKAILKVDYGLLLTFFFFFIFANNISRVDIINNFLSRIMNKNELLVGTLSCQVISNVPSAILLSHFTNDYHQLLVSVNIGGLGTLIASLASLIALKKYLSVYKKTKTYIITFSSLNFIFLAILFLFSYFIF